MKKKRIDEETYKKIIQNTAEKTVFFFNDIMEKQISEIINDDDLIAIDQVFNITVHSLLIMNIGIIFTTFSRLDDIKEANYKEKYDSIESFINELRRQCHELLEDNNYRKLIKVKKNND